jgi:antitoxin (DNA-binding transcriptional repressor) of toxin-antitoxin stability system
MEIEAGIKQAKSSLSKLVAAAQKGERVYLVNRKRRVAELVAVRPAAAQRGRGLLKGKIRLPAGWSSQQAREQSEKELLQDLGLF